MPKTVVGKHISGQLMRSGTSPGSNYEEACGALNLGQILFINWAIVLKELKESRFWLKLINLTHLIKPKRVEPLIQECQELCAIVAKSILTARKNK